MDLFERMLGHDRWMTDHLLTLSNDLTEAQLDQEFDIGHRTLRKTFDHMILAVDFWTGLMLGTPVPWEPKPGSIGDMLKRHTRSYDHFATVANDLVSSGRMDETFVDHYDYPQSFGATIIHVIYHNVQHRSEVLHILQRLGMTDLTEGDPQEWEHMTGRIKDAGKPVESSTPSA